MPVKAVGKKIVEVRTGKVKGTVRSKAKASASARIRNAAIARKHGSKHG